MRLAIFLAQTLKRRLPTTPCGHNDNAWVHKMPTSKAVKKPRMLVECDALEPMVIRACCAADGKDPDDWIAAAERPRWATYITLVRATMHALATPSTGMINHLVTAMKPAGVDESEAAILSAHYAIEDVMPAAVADLPDLYEPD